MRALAQSLRRPADPPGVTATVTTPSGETLVLVYEDGAWRVDASAIDLYRQTDPKSAVGAFVRAYRNRRWDVLLRFVPSTEADGLDAKKLEASWNGEQRAEMEALVLALEASLATAKAEILGDRATMAYGTGGTVQMVQEAGVWKIEEF